MSETPKNYGVVLYPGFQALDVFGPLDALNILSGETPMNLAILAATLNPVSTKHGLSKSQGSNFGESIVPTHTFSDPPKDLEVLLIPGGYGARDEETIAPAIDFVKAVYPSVKYVLTVCTGSVILARTGWLDGKTATSNKRAFDWARSQGPNVSWVPKARWVVCDNIWTSSGISAGMDLIYAFIEKLHGKDIATYLANCSEYERRTDPEDDPFAEIWNAK